MLEQSRDSLHEQMEETKRMKVVLAILEKHGILF
jgi:hypothetical protein